MILVACVIVLSVSAAEPVAKGSLTVDEVKDMLPSGIDAKRIAVGDGAVIVELPFKGILPGGRDSTESRGWQRHCHCRDIPDGGTRGCYQYFQGAFQGQSRK
jgi:hypothetical protein